MVSSSDANTTIDLSVDTQRTGATTTTSGLSAPAAVANSGGSITLTGASLTTSGNGSAGLVVNGAGPRRQRPTDGHEDARGRQGIDTEAAGSTSLTGASVRTGAHWQTRSSGRAALDDAFGGNDHHRGQ